MSSCWQQPRAKPEQGSGCLDITVARRRAVDRVRSVYSRLPGQTYDGREREIDEFWERATLKDDRAGASRLRSLTDLQSEALTLAYYEDLTRARLRPIERASRHGQDPNQRRHETSRRSAGR